jgi:N-acetyl-anhydromuramyl-L-alanine amidase AmpD
MRFPSLASLLTLVGMTGCATNVMIDDGVAESVAVALDDDYRIAADAHGVPVDLLKAVGYVETRWQKVDTDGHAEGVDGPAAYGVMALGGDRLSHAAALASETEDDAANDVWANINASAALLAEAGYNAGAGADLESWRIALQDYSWIEEEEARLEYAALVFDVLRTGAEAYAESGELIARLDPHPEIAARVAGANHAAGPDYAAAVWRASPNFSGRPSGARVSMIIIHTCEGAYAGCWGHLKRSGSGVSAHYVVKEDGSEITQLVRESSKAWHIGATYKCSLNDNVDCTKNGQGSNNFTVGIEHGGFASQTVFPAGQIEASAKLACDISRDNAVPRDRNHILGHGQLQPYNRSDPGPNWPWAHYMDRVRAHCEGDTVPGPDDPPLPPGGAVNIVIDSNNANNTSSQAQVTVGTGWTSASSTAGYYGSGYWFGDTGATDDAIAFKFYLPTAGTHSIEGWWTAGTNRSTAAQFVAFNASGVEVGRTEVSQQSNGSQWVSLGSSSFSAGWNRVELRRRGSSGKVVIADAVRIR